MFESHDFLPSLRWQHPTAESRDFGMPFFFSDVAGPLDVRRWKLLTCCALFLSCHISTFLHSRAERNRQSAAASRERKKRHIKELEENVKYLTEVNSTLQYRFDVQKQSWEEKEMCLQSEIRRLRHQLNRESAFRASPPQNHPMTLHHLTHRGPVTY